MTAEKPEATLAVLRRTLPLSDATVQLLLIEGRLREPFARRTIRHIFFVFDLTDSCPTSEEALASLQALASSVARRCRQEDRFSAWALGVREAVRQSRPMAEVNELHGALRQLVPVARRGGTRLLPLWAQMGPEIEESRRRGETVALILATDGEIWDVDEFTPPPDLSRVGIAWVGEAWKEGQAFWPGACGWPLGDVAAQGESLRPLLALDEDGLGVESASVTMVYPPAFRPELVWEVTDPAHPRRHEAGPAGQVVLPAPLGGPVLCRVAMAWAGEVQASEVRGELTLRFGDATRDRTEEMACEEVDGLAWEEEVTRQVREELQQKYDLSWEWNEGLIHHLEGLKYRGGAEAGPARICCPKCGGSQPFTLSHSRCTNCGQQVLLHRTRLLRNEGPLRSAQGVLILLRPYDPGAAPKVSGKPLLLPRQYTLPEGATLSLDGGHWQLDPADHAGEVTLTGHPCAGVTTVQGYDFIEFVEERRRYLLIDLRR